MKVLVVNCLDWIGFHLVNQLLEKGYKVDGLHTLVSKKREHLSMFLGRNSSFLLMKSIEMIEYDVCFIIGAYEEIEEIKSKHLIHMKHEPIDQIGTGTRLEIQMPLLFGEWMPMNNGGMYDNGTYIPFESKDFLSEVVYINDFTKNLLQWITAIRDQSNTKEIAKISFENMPSPQEYTYIKNKLQIVLTHYEQFKDYYCLK